MSLRAFRRIWQLPLALALGLVVTAAACGGDDDADLRAEVIETYASGVHSMYSTSLASAQTMDRAIDAFLDAPSAASLAIAKATWLSARDDYGPTEAFRFYGGPIDHEETGIEGFVNAWPLDEGYIDYVEGSPNAGIINMPDEFPTIDAGLLLSLNEQGGEENVSTGWHAIEFLLWGQDGAVDGPGNRSFEDYATHPTAERRATYLRVATDLLITHLQQMVDAWDPAGTGNYYDTFLALPAEEALVNILTGIGELSRGELAGERMTVAYEERSQEDEHSCFSDNTTSDIVANALGVQIVLNGDFGAVSGPGVLDLIEDSDPDLASRLRAEVAQSVASARTIPVPFDQSLRTDIPNDAPGRQAILATIESLGMQTDSIVAAADSLGVRIDVS